MPRCEGATVVVTDTKDAEGEQVSCEIAKAHGGTLEVSSTAAETRFTFRMPLAG